MLRKRWAGVFYYLYCRIVSPAFADIPPGSIPHGGCGSDDEYRRTRLNLEISSKSLYVKSICDT